MTGARLGAPFAEARRRLRDAGGETPDLDARVLATAAFAVSETQLMTRPDEAVSPEALGRLDGWLSRRASGEPVARILGRREFWGLDFALTDDALVPRPDTETLVEAVIAARPNRAAPLRVLDLGTGSGCILIALLTEYGQATGLGVDLSAGAVETARGNAARLGVGERCAFRQGSWDAGLTEAFDLIVSNPPYIATAEIETLDAEVRRHDPRLALDGGPDGLDAYRALADLLPRRLAPSGLAALEVGYGQAITVAGLMAEAGFSTWIADDLAGIGRVVMVFAS